MCSKFLVSLMTLFFITGFVCASSSIIVEDKMPAKVTSDAVNDEDDKKEADGNKNIYIFENMLYIKTSLTNDLIYVYTNSGLCIDKFVKDTDLIVKDASAYPIGVLIITNGKELTTKVVK